MNRRSSQNVNRARRNARGKAYRAEGRKKAIEALGGMCKCCGETTLEFLALDHIHGGGTKERREIANNTSSAMYRRVAEQGYPTDRYQILCHNCNSAKAWYGACPHQRP
jgi:hypothetical protein